MVRNLIEYACPKCDAGYGYTAEREGTVSQCRHCKTTFTIPTGLPPREVELCESEFEDLTPEEEAIVRRHVTARQAGEDVGDTVALPPRPGKANSPLLETLLGLVGVAIASWLGIRKRS